MAKHLESNGVDVASSKALTLGLELKMNPATEQVVGNQDANNRMSREYRSGFEINSIASKAAS